MERQTVIITGAAGGIGAQIAETLAEKGYNIAILDIAAETSAINTINVCRSYGADVLYISGDVSDYETCAAAIAKTAEHFGGIYALINNAGITRDALLMRMNESHFDTVISINLKSVYNMSKLVLPYMVKSREGRIVSISSVVGIYGNAGQTNYAASKAGIIGFTKSLAKEVGSRNITVNAIAPGYIQTAMTDNLNDKAKESISSGIALKRLGTPEDIAYAAEFLLDNRASYITAQVIGIDGGMSGI